jgi:hypothetical protein
MYLPSARIVACLTQSTLVVSIELACAVSRDKSEKSSERERNLDQNIENCRVHDCIPATFATYCEMQ